MPQLIPILSQTFINSSTTRRLTLELQNILLSGDANIIICFYANELTYFGYFSDWMNMPVWVYDAHKVAFAGNCFIVNCH